MYVLGLGFVIVLWVELGHVRINVITRVVFNVCFSVSGRPSDMKHPAYNLLQLSCMNCCTFNKVPRRTCIWLM